MWANRRFQKHERGPRQSAKRTAKEQKNIRVSHFLQEFAFHSQLPGGDLLRLLALGLAWSESVGNVDPQLALLLRQNKKRQKKADLVEKL